MNGCLPKFAPKRFHRVSGHNAPTEEQPVTVIMSGLLGAGKTTVLEILTHHKDGMCKNSTTYHPCNVHKCYSKNFGTLWLTNHSHVETMTSSSTRLVAYSWDVSGRNQVRPIWRDYYLRRYYDKAKVIVFVVDSADPSQMNRARYELKTLCDRLQRISNELASIPVLILANKQDLPTALPLSEVRTRLRIDKYCEQREWRLQGISATQDIGVHEAFEWVLAGAPSLKSLYGIPRFRCLYALNRAPISIKNVLRISKNGEDMVSIMSLLRFICVTPPEISAIIVSYLGDDGRVQDIKRFVSH
mmetsp:Transcript_11244/g.15016  ORF Transcript_11244/g.15016 Transcript_11244/m.15016 type:complete len:301 (-) Transcript_11244:647-1549(-)